MKNRTWLILLCISLVWVGIVAWARLSPVQNYGEALGDTTMTKVSQYFVDVPEPVADGKFSAAETFMLMLEGDRNAKGAALDDIRLRWQPGYVPMLLEIGRLSHWHAPFQVLEEKTGKEFGFDSRKWYRELWRQDYESHPNYASFKSSLYSKIDPRFAEYFDDDYAATIRLDEIQWGGVVRDGIPPLKNPRMLSAGEATYLDDSNVVFGLEINGDARAYPKRILAWHEMFKDIVGDVSINGVYCTLCGSMIVYKTEYEGKHYELGTSGFLYRSNKLMYDHATKSMWSTLTGEPVVGQLVGKGIKLERLHVVTTTWSEWRRRHPETTVLSLDTGHRRDYGEGVAYKSYFATDRLMFDVPFSDTRLKNKQEVLALRFDDVAGEQLAIDSDFLLRNRVYHDQIGEHEFVVLTDASGANRVYDARGARFEAWDGDTQATDQQGNVWSVDEAGLTNSDGKVLARLPGHRGFWFGWHAAYPQTRLVQ